LTRWFTIGALALAERGANAVGAVRLCCAPEALEIELVRASTFSEGFAPGGVVETVHLRVPYLSVRGLVRKNRTLYLTLDPQVVAPYNRFALARFTEDPAEALAQAYRERARARWASYLVPWPAGVLAAALAPDAQVGGALGRASLGIVVALAIWAVLREIVTWRSWGGPISDRLCEELTVELSSHLGLGAATPAPPSTSASGHDTVPRRAPTSSLSEPSAPGLFTPGRARIALVVGLAAIGAVAFLSFIQRFTSPHEPPPAVPLLVAGVASAAERAHLDDRAFSPAPAGPRCLCARADSPLWKDGVPELSVLTFTGEGGVAGEVTPAPSRGGKMRYDFDLAVINNAAHSLRDVRVTLTFARRDDEGRRVGAVDRGLFWEGQLGPARAIKWHVSAPGTEMRVDPSVSGTLEEQGTEPASPDAFYALTSAHYRPVRVHAAAMLAYLRDPRALEVARALGGQSEDEQRVLDRIARAAAQVFACSMKRAGDRIEACVFNGSSRVVEGARLREVREAPRGAAPPDEKSFAIDGIIPIHEGVQVTFPVPAEAEEIAEEWEVELKRP